MRKLTPELLDHLPHDDPGALRSRADLRRINFFMGNERWITSMIPENTRHITEIGAGEGHLLTRLAGKFPQAEITAYDLAPRPNHLSHAVKWIQGDLFTQAPPAHGGTLIANLRASLPLLLGKLATPFIHPITRHDMRVSIEAGFAPSELAAALGLPEKGHVIRETNDWRGAIRLVCQRSD
jgi:hypothetical protein